ncbi:Arabinanase/levansucrase/invertase [Neocallimastix lanati (nom. inval.)]|nr:Arabinanase/levansucrase/invertase [Neocallimastix sp. JGI-2020a]
MNEWYSQCVQSSTPFVQSKNNAAPANAAPVFNNVPVFNNAPVYNNAPVNNTPVNNAPAKSAPVNNAPVNNGANAANSAPSPALTLKTSNYSAGVSVHDPSIVKNGNKYYIFGSHMDTAFSTDLRTWKKLYTGVNENNRMFSNLFSKSNYAPFSYVGKNEAGGYSVWAPDVIYNPKMKKWVQYFCTTSTFIKSNLCYATADNIEGPYTYQGTFLYSGFVGNTVGQTNLKTITGGIDGNRYYPNNSYNFHVYPNAIDPSVFYDFNGRLWMVYGSWSGGIYILELNESTGLPKHNINNGNNTDKYFGKKLAGGNHQSIEGPYILPHSGSGYYYLFVSYGGLTSNGGYQIRMFRSKNPDGPYVDARGRQFMDGNNADYGIKVMGNYNLPGLSKAYMAPGHNSAFRDTDNKVYLVYHTRFNDGAEFHEPRVHQMFLNQDGWLCAAPYAYSGETISPTGYSMGDMAGSYKIVFHYHTKVNGDISNSYTVKLESNLSVTGKYTGSWEYTANTNFMTIKINNVTYKGVFLKQQDEGKTGTLVAFTAVGDNNDTIWGVKAN